MSARLAIIRQMFVKESVQPLQSLVSFFGAVVLTLALVGCGPTSRQSSHGSSAAWAYPKSPPPTSPPPVVERNIRLHLSGSQKSFSSAELQNLFLAPDWHPDQHPPMPAVVAKGRKPNVMACAFCHLPTGDGRPENASLAGLPRDYIIEQMRAFRKGTRQSSVAARIPTELMVAVAKAATDAEIAAAADYFSALGRHDFTTIVEVNQVPTTRTMGWVYSPNPAGGSEPIGSRIIEMPVDFERFEHRDPSVRYLAYVPVGSIARGTELARTWGGAGKLACASCHGQDLRGVGSVPPLAGRSPTYIARQLNDLKTGARHGPQTEPMKPVVAAMRNEDVVALAAFIGARKP